MGPGEPWRITLRNVAIAAAAGVFLAFIGALGTDRIALPMRLLYWVPLMLVGSLIAHVTVEGLTRIIREATNPWLFGAVLAVGMAVPITALVWAYSGVMLDTNFSLRALPDLFLSVLIVCAAMTAITMTVNAPGQVTHAPPAGSPAALVRFMERLPPRLKGAVIYAISAEDHYLKLHTSKGTDLILMRMSDAIVELEGLEGAQTHRSWWVARDAVENARREGDRMVLTIKGGVEAPVSRPNVRPLREAGWY
jgi:DNA-binding LytR/AlgR family response regulator